MRRRSLAQNVDDLVGDHRGRHSGPINHLLQHTRELVSEIILHPRPVEFSNPRHQPLLTQRLRPKLRIDRTGPQTSDRNLFLTRHLQLPPQRVRVGLQSTFTGRINGHEGRTHEGSEGGEVDDPATVGRETEKREKGASDANRAVEVD